VAGRQAFCCANLVYVKVLFEGGTRMANSRGTFTVAFGDAQSGKSHWAQTHLDDINEQWFGTNNIVYWDMYTRDAAELASILAFPSHPAYDGLL